MQSEPSGEGFVCVLFLTNVSELYFSYILLNRRLLPLLPLSSSALHLHIFLCFKRIIWWQDYIKPTGLLNALLENISTSPQVHRYLLSPGLGLGGRMAHLPTLAVFAMSCKLGTRKSDGTPFLRAVVFKLLYRTLKVSQGCSRTPQQMKHLPPNKENTNFLGLYPFQLFLIALNLFHIPLAFPSPPNTHTAFLLNC